jgi:hypothetical protein
MHKYASPSPDARELVSELEFVWDQVKSNVPASSGGSSGSSPLHTQSGGGVGLVPMETSQDLRLSSSGEMLGRKRGRERDRGREDYGAEGPPLRVMSPMSQSQEDEAEAEEREEFVDAPDSQTHDDAVMISSKVSGAEGGAQQDSPAPPPAVIDSQITAGSPSRDPRWRRRMEAAMVRMTAEIAALREQLENRRLFASSRRYRVMRFLASIAWFAVKHIAVDVVVLGIVLLWMRRKKDRRLENAMRVLLGDAVVMVQKVGAEQVAALKQQLGGKPARPN